MKILIWMFVLLAGFGLMFYSHRSSRSAAEPLPWADAFMYVGNGEPTRTGEALAYTEARVLFLPLPGVLREVAKALEGAPDQAMSRAIRSLREKAILDPAFREDFAPAMLAEGRLPQPGADEAVAGSSAVHKGEVVVAGRRLQVVGVLRRDVALFADAYLLPPDSAAAGLFAPGAADMQNAYIIRMPREEAVQAETRKRLQAEFPRGRFTPVVGDGRVEVGPYFLYLLGMALMLFGGSVLFVRLYAYLAGVVPWPVLRGPLAALRDWRRLLYGLHALFFGILLLAAAGVYFLPPVQTLLVAALHGEIEAGTGPLGVAGKAYGSGSVALAAVATVAINFLFGTVLVITLPSMVVPGIGIFATIFRSLMIGLMLAPSTVRMAGVMLPHSFTLLVEMEAYIVATLFVLLIPIYLFRRSEGPTVFRRYGRALLVNLKGLLLVFGILAIVAVYEAVEVILQIR
ncbi:MAG: hypothetical protein NTX87_04930 [Planctomycetota bacterium]|nr:hypothetical protein [Planctomycetota bacterium]